jgi:ABC-type transport system substrate-binding protein
MVTTEGRKENVKILAVLACIVLCVVLVAPVAPQTVASNPEAMNVIQYRFFSSEDALFKALLTPDSQGGVDIMGWPLTRAEYVTVMDNPSIVVEPLPEADEFGLGFDCNWTNLAHPGGRSAMNYTDFRQALACLVDKNGVISGPTLQGFATRGDTLIPQPLMSGFVNPAVSYPNYPWEFNITNALHILYRGGWYSHAVYPAFADLLLTYANGTLSTYSGLRQGVVYPSVDPYGQWGQTDTYVNTRAGQPIDTLQGYVRNYYPYEEDLGDMFNAELAAIGMPFNNHYVPPEDWLTNPNDPWKDVVEYLAYDYATFDLEFTPWPGGLDSLFAPAGIHSFGPNLWLVDDANMTHYAHACDFDPNETEYMSDLMAVQDILVNEAYFVSVYSPATYCAYKTGMLGQIDELGLGTQGAQCGGQLMNWLTLNSKKTDTINYTGSPASTPESNMIYYGEYGPPAMINPIFSSSYTVESGFQVLDEIFTYPLATNPYNTRVPGSALTGFPPGGDLPWMAYAWKTELINDPYNASNPQWTNITYWFRHDVTWHDGAPFTTDDINFTIYVNSLYGDAFQHFAMSCDANVSLPWTPDASYSATPGDPNYARPYFQKDVTPSDPTGSYTCSILVNSQDWSNLYFQECEVVPYHLYRYIVPSNVTVAEEGLSTDGLHGIWPGQAATADNILPGAPFTLAQLHNNPETTLVGTGPWKYRSGSTNATSATSPNGGITLDAYPNFFLKIGPGEMTFQYRWLNADPGAQPSGGYYKIGLADLVMLANAYGTGGTPPSAVPLSGGRWNPAADLAAPSGVIGLSDLTTLALHYGWYWGNYSYNAPYPPAEQADPP